MERLGTHKAVRALVCRCSWHVHKWWKTEQGLLSMTLTLVPVALADLLSVTLGTYSRFCTGSSCCVTLQLWCLH